MKTPDPYEEANLEELSRIKGICLDIDDTLTTEGKLTAEAYDSLWSAKRAGLAVVPITGRPAGWCDHFARFWPVDAVVGENGAFTFFMKDGVRQRLDTLKSGEVVRGKLVDFEKAIVAHFPEAKFASDQAYREYDLAIDICEDVSPWKSERVDELLDFCKSQGAHAKLSSIHVNTWFGDYDKLSGFKAWLAGASLGIAADEWLFIGDSPNDEPLFKGFKYSVGVANLKRYLDRLQNPPRWITKSESGAGFSEMVARLVVARRGGRGSRS